MKHFLKNKKGVTILEGLIALALLAVVATGTFAVLLSASRKTGGPDIREEMIYAVDKANNLLQGYIVSQGYASTMSNLKTTRPSAMDDNNQATGADVTANVFARDFSNGLCSMTGSSALSVSDSTPLAVGTHEIPCLLPPICDRQDSKGSTGDTSRKSYFFYQVASGSFSNHVPDADRVKNTNIDFSVGSTDNGSQGPVKITFQIKCNGFIL